MRGDKKKSNKMAIFTGLYSKTYEGKVRIAKYLIFLPMLSYPKEQKQTKKLQT